MQSQMRVAEYSCYNRAETTVSPRLL
jgi:hypothetical protein